MESLPNRLYNPSLSSGAAKKIQRLKRELVRDLHGREGPFSEAVRGVRAEWGVAPREMLPSETERETHSPVEPSLGKFGYSLENAKTIDRWEDALKPLREAFVPPALRRGPAWNDFFGACVMCDPPETRLLEFAEFGHLYPSVFWPVVDCEDDEIDVEKLHSMVAPPIERVFIESEEDGEPFMRYRIVVDEETELEDVRLAFRAIKAAYKHSPVGKHSSKGRPPIDKLVAVQCAILYDEHNEVDPEDARFWRWTYKSLADRFREYGVKNKRSAEEHVKVGRTLRNLPK